MGAVCCSEVSFSKRNNGDSVQGGRSSSLSETVNNHQREKQVESAAVRRENAKRAALEVDTSIRRFLTAVGSNLDLPHWRKHVVDALDDNLTAVEQSIQPDWVPVNSFTRNSVHGGRDSEAGVSSTSVGSTPAIENSKGITVQVPTSGSSNVYDAAVGPLGTSGGLPHAVRVHRLVYFVSFQQNPVVPSRIPSFNHQGCLTRASLMPLVPEVRMNSDEHNNSLNASLDRLAPSEDEDHDVVVGMDAFDFSPVAVGPTNRRTITRTAAGSSSKRRRSGSKSMEGHSSREQSQNFSESDVVLSTPVLAGPKNDAGERLRTIVISSSLGATDDVQNLAFIETAQFFAARVLRCKAAAAARRSGFPTPTAANFLSPVGQTESLGGFLGSETTGGGFPRFGHMSCPLVFDNLSCKAVYLSHDDALRDRLVTGTNVTACREGVVVEGVLLFTSIESTGPLTSTKKAVRSELRYKDDKFLDIMACRVKFEEVVRGILVRIGSGTPN